MIINVGSCQHIFELFLKMKDHDQPCHDPCPHCGQLRVNQIIGSSPLFGDSYSLGHHPLPDDWKGFLKRVKDKNPGSNINI